MKVEGNALEQSRLQTRLWNELVELSIKNDKEYDSICHECLPDLSLLDEEIEALDKTIGELTDQIKLERQKSRSGKVDTAYLRKSVVSMKNKRKKLKDDRKILKKSSKELMQPKLEELNQEHDAAIKLIRQGYASKGLYWGNYNAVIKSYLVGRSQVLKKRGSGENAGLRYHRFDGCGRWTVQIQGGMTIADAFACNSGLFQIDPIPSDTWSRGRCYRRKHARTNARIRIGSSGRDPIWMEIPIVMHRQIPENASIKFASITAKRLADRLVWKLNVTATVGAEIAKKTGEVVAIDLGWRKDSNGLRAGYLFGSDGKSEAICLDESFRKTATKIEGLSQTEKTRFNAVMDHLKKWLQDNKDNLPEWIREKTKHIGLWESYGKLYGLFYSWSANRINGDDLIFSLIELWRKQDKHLWQYRENLRDKMEGRRRDQYRVFAKRIAKEYDILVLEDMAITTFKKKGNAEDGVDHKSALRDQASLVSPGLFRQELVRAMKACGKDVAYVNPAYTTRSCPFCGHICERKADITLKCDKCGETYDRDMAGAKNILRRFAEEKLVEIQEAA